MVILADRDDQAAGSSSTSPVPVTVHAARAWLMGELASPPSPAGVVVLVDEVVPEGRAPELRREAAALVRAGFATLQLDLLTRAERAGRPRELPVLAERLEGALGWIAGHPALRELPIGLFGEGAGAAAALVVAARAPAVQAIVSRCGRPDLVHRVLHEIRCPTLWILGGADPEMLDLHHRALRQIGANARLHVVPGVGRNLDEPGALDDALRLAAAWFRAHLARSMHHHEPWTTGSTTDAKPGSSSRAR